MLQLPEGRGLVFKFLFTKTVRNEAKHACNVRPDFDMPDTCGWKSNQGPFFAVISTDSDIEDTRGLVALSAVAMTARLQKHAKAAGLGDRGFTMYSLRVGAAMSREVYGQDLPSVMAEIGWKSASVARRYMKGAAGMLQGGGASGAAEAVVSQTDRWASKLDPVD